MTLPKTATDDAREQVRPRAKTLTHPRLGAIRSEGRVAAALLMKRVIGEEGERVAHIARVLRVSETLVWCWLDPDAHQQFAVGDLMALKIGANSVAWAYADEICRYLARAPAPGRTAVEHAIALARAGGEAATALTSGGDRAKRVAALRALSRCVASALADEGEG